MTFRAWKASSSAEPTTMTPMTTHWKIEYDVPQATVRTKRPDMYARSSALRVIISSSRRYRRRAPRLTMS